MKKTKIKKTNREIFKMLLRKTLEKKIEAKNAETLLRMFLKKWS